MSPDTPFFVVSGCTLLVVSGYTFLSVPRLAATLMAASVATPTGYSRVHLNWFLALIIFVIKERADPVLSARKEIAGVASGAVKCILRIVRKIGFFRLIECHYIKRRENKGVAGIPSTGLEPAILTLGGSRLIQLGYEG